MIKLILPTTMIAAMLLSGCANTMGTTTLSDDVQSKTQEKMVDKTMSNYGIPTFKKEKTTEEKLADVATGKTSISDVATDLAADQMADMALKQAL
ncbi:MAG: hypothetical protein KJO45_07430 [Sulfurovum sp.]|nr:hypothetical protein [Sulfurovum sp.]